VTLELRLFITLRILSGASYLAMIWYAGDVKAVPSIFWSTICGIDDHHPKAARLGHFSDFSDVEAPPFSSDEYLWDGNQPQQVLMRSRKQSNQSDSYQPQKALRSRQQSTSVKVLLLQVM
jgi:hypothetical protein